MTIQLPDDKTKKIPNDIELTIETIISLDGYNTSIWEKYKKEEEEDTKVSGTRYYGRNYPKFNQMQSLVGILENFEEFESDYKLYLGDNFELFCRIIEGLTAEQERKDLTRNRMIQAPIYRENFMHKRFMELVESLPGEKFFGEFGRCHTSTQELDEWCNYYHFRSLATRIQNTENDHVKGKVMSIGGYYPNAEYGNENFQISNIRNVSRALKDEDVSLVYVSSDSNYFNEVLQSFKFLIVNNKTLYAEFEDEDEKVVQKGWKKKGYKNDYCHFDALYGLNNFKLKGLSNQFSDHGLSGLANTQMTYGGALTVYSSYNVFNRFSYLIMEPYTANLGDTSSVRLTSNQFMWHVGGNLSDLEMFSIAPNIGFGYQQMKLKISDWYNDQPVLLGEFFQETVEPENDLVYKNGAFLIDLALDTRVNIKFISLGLFGGYQFDVSHKKWWSNGSIANESPKTSFTGWHAHGSLSIFFHN
jgi:hypothetical protein